MPIVAPPIEVHATAATGISGAPRALPHGAQIQESFGDEHDLSGIAAHVGGAAAAAADELGARAFTIGESIAFSAQPDLRLAAHEAAHVVQQRAGVALTGGVGHPGDRYERQARAVADAVVRGHSAAPLLPAPAASAAPAASVQCDSFTSVGNDGQIVVNDPSSDSYKRHVAQVERAAAERLYYKLALTVDRDATTAYADNASVTDLMVYLKAYPNVAYPTEGDYMQAVRFLQGWDRARSSLPHVPMRLDEKLSGTPGFGSDAYPLYYTGQTPPPVTVVWADTDANKFWLSYYDPGVLRFTWEMIFPSGQTKRLPPVDPFIQTVARSPTLDDPGTYLPRVTIEMGRGGDPNGRVTWTGAGVTALSITKEQFSQQAFRKGVAEKSAEGDDPMFEINASGQPLPKAGAKPLDFSGQRQLNWLRVGALAKYREAQKISKKDFEAAKKYLEAKNEGLKKAEASLPGGSHTYVLSGVFVSSERPMSTQIHAYMASRPNRAGKYKVRLYDATLNQKTPTEHDGEATVPNGPIERAKMIEAERLAILDMASNWKANNDYPSGTVHLAIASHENPGGSFDVKIPQGNWKKTLRSILSPIAAIAGLAAMAFGQAEIAVPLIYVAAGAGLANLALGIEHRIKMGTFAWDTALLIDVLSVVAMVAGLGALSKAFQTLSFAGKSWYLIGTAATDATQGYLIGVEAGNALDEAKAEFNSDMASATSADQRAQITDAYERKRATIIGGAIVSDSFAVVSVAGGVVGALKPGAPGARVHGNEPPPVINPTVKPHVTDITPPVKPPVVETKPPVVHETQPPVVERKPPVVEPKPPPKPPVVETKPPVVDTAPPVEVKAPPPTGTAPHTTPTPKIVRPIPKGGTPIDAAGRKPPKKMMENPDLYYFENGKFKRRPEPAPPFRPTAAPPTGVKVKRPIPEGGVPIDAPGVKAPKKLLDNKELYYYKNGKFMRRPEPPPAFRQGGKDPRAIPCFPAGTPVATPRGLTAIEDIAEGSDVLAFDAATGATVARRVTAVLQNRTAILFEIAIGDEVVRATASHPFWVENRGAFVPADRLEAGYSLRTDAGALATIGSVTLRRVAETPTWNLTIEDCHTYFVGAARVLVHNAGESGGKIYIGRNPAGQIVYVGLTMDDLIDRQTAHREDAIRDPEKYGFKKDITLEVVDGMTGLTDDEMRWHERRVYDELKGRGEPLQNILDETTTYEKLNALYEKYC